MLTCRACRPSNRTGSKSGTFCSTANALRPSETTICTWSPFRRELGTALPRQMRSGLRRVEMRLFIPSLGLEDAKWR